MLTYRRQKDDVQYRNIDVYSRQEEEFHPFPKDEISYNEKCVLEILRADGTKHIEYGGEKEKVIVIRDQTKLIRIYDRIPRARLWIRDGNNEMDRMRYKVPIDLPADTDKCVGIWFPSDWGDPKLCGDPYFEAAFYF